MDWLIAAFRDHWEAIVTTAVLFSGGGVLAWRRWGPEHRKLAAEADLAEAQTQLAETQKESELAKTVASLSTQVTDAFRLLEEERKARRALEERFELLEHKYLAQTALVKQWRKGISRLLVQIKDLHATPVWLPEE